MGRAIGPSRLTSSTNRQTPQNATRTRRACTKYSRMTSGDDDVAAELGGEVTAGLGDLLDQTMGAPLGPSQVRSSWSFPPVWSFCFFCSNPRPTTVAPRIALETSTRVRRQRCYRPRLRNPRPMARCRLPSACLFLNRRTPPRSRLVSPALPAKIDPSTSEKGGVRMRWSSAISWH